MGETIQNSLSHKLNKDSLTHLIKFNWETNDGNPLDKLWDRIVETMQSCLEREDDDKIFRLLLPDLHLFTPLL
jgi:hypothetical protein